MASNAKSNTKPNAINGTNGKGKGKGKKQAQEAAVNVSQYHLELSAEYLGLTLYKDALRCANRALELDPKNLAARVRRGIARKNLGLLDAALADFDTVLAIDPSFVKARESREEIYLAKQKGREEEEPEDAITPALTPTPTTEDDFRQAANSSHESSGEVEPRVDKEDGVTPPSSSAEDSKVDEEEGDENEDDEDEDEDEDDDIMVNSVSSVTSSEKPSSSKGAEDYTLPHYHSSPPQSSEGNEEPDHGHPPENDLDHIGSGTACRFYNHNGCNRGTTCTFGHAPDSKSIRDERGKNVCLYFLIGKCKWDNQSCIYSHSKASLTASVSSPNASSDPSSSSSQPILSASFAPLSGSSSAPATRPPEGDPKGWWNIPERTAEIRDLVLGRDQNGRMAHEARVASFNARNKNKRSKKIGKNHNNGTNVYGTRNVAHTNSRIPPNLEALFNQMRARYYDSNDHDDYDYNYSDLDEMDSFDMDLEDELEMEQRYLNGGFTDDEVMELLCQGVKPWDDDAGMVLAALSGNW